MRRFVRPRRASALANNSRCVFSEKSMPSAYVTISSSERPTLSFCVKTAPLGGIGLRHRRRNQQRDRGQEQHARLQARADAVVLLDVILESAEQERCAEHEQGVGDDRPGDATPSPACIARRARR